MIRTHSKCCGYIGGLPCPYTAANNNVCRLHANTKHMIVFKTPGQFCETCGKKGTTIALQCKRHRFCTTCFIEVSIFKECPYCEYINKLAYDEAASSQVAASSNPNPAHHHPLSST